MRLVRTVFALVIALGLTLSPVAADLARAFTVNDHVLMQDGQPTSVKKDDCSCCKGAAKCPQSICAAKCAGGQAIFQDNTFLVKIQRTRLIAEPLASLHWPSSPPDPPPPRV